MGGRFVSRFRRIAERKVFSFILIFFFLSTPLLFSCGSGGGSNDDPVIIDEVITKLTNSEGMATFDSNVVPVTFVILDDSDNLVRIPNAKVSLYNKNSGIYIVVVKADGYYSTSKVFNDEMLRFEELMLTQEDDEGFNVIRRTNFENLDFPLGNKIDSLHYSELVSYIENNYPTVVQFIFLWDLNVTDPDDAQIDIYESPFENILYLHLHQNSSLGAFSIFGPKEANALVFTTIALVVVGFAAVGAISYMNIKPWWDKAKESIEDEFPHISLISPINDTISDPKVTFRWQCADKEYDYNSWDYKIHLLVSPRSNVCDLFGYHEEDHILNYVTDLQFTEYETTKTLLLDSDSLQNGRKYYWAVRVYDYSHAEWICSSNRFTYLENVENLPPDKPSNPSPPHLSTNQPLDVKLKWRGTDPDGDDLFYAIAFGDSLDKDGEPTIHPLPLHDTNWDPGVLKPDTRYYWLVGAFDYDNSSPVKSDLWEFVTGSGLDFDTTIYSPVTGHWYQLNNTELSWNDAKIVAESKGGYLATITSSEENLWISNNFTIESGYLPWFGGNDLQNEGQWSWVTGEPWSYSNWAGGEPNNKYPDDCVKFHPYFKSGHGNLWNDGVCSREYISLIEYDNSPN